MYQCLRCGKVFKDRHAVKKHLLYKHFQDKLTIDYYYQYFPEVRPWTSFWT